jgi:hypothetical protein
LSLQPSSFAVLCVQEREKVARTRTKTMAQQKTEFSDQLSRWEWVQEQAERLCDPYLSDWRERVEAYWEREIDGIDSKELLKALTACGFGKEEAKALATKGRPDKVETLANGTLQSMVRRFAEKIDKIVCRPDDCLRATGLTLEEHPPSEATVLHEGATDEHTIAGLVCITGTVWVHPADGGDSRHVKIFSKFVTHPFWQYSSM